MLTLRKVSICGLSALLMAFGQWAAAQNLIDMKGKTALVTGSTSGLGETVARRLGAMGATVIVHGLNEKRGEEIAAEITKAGPGKAVYYSGDLSSLEQVRALARRVRANHPELQLLINNAGIGGASNDARRESADGYELVFAVNYLSHFLLTRELLPLLEAGAPARIVNVASIGQRPIDFDDVMMKNNYQTAAAYSQSKLALIMFTMTLAEKVDPRKVTVNSLHPATFMNTPMVTSSGRQPMSSVEDGANAVMQLAVGTAIAGRTGLYFNQMNEGRANQQAYDAEARKKLWDLSVELAQSHPAAAAPVDGKARLDRLETAVVRAEDVRAIRKLQRAYGYYADRGLWEDLGDLFADDAIANYPSGGFDGNASIRAMFVQNLGQGKAGLAEGRIYNHTILQPVVDLAPDGASATGRWRVLGMLGRFPGSATWADSLYRFDYVKRDGHWKIKELTAYAGSGGGYADGWVQPKPRPPGAADTSPIRFNLAHPADRPWIDPCEADTSACVVPFPYPNRGGIKPPANVSARISATESTSADRAADLVRRAQLLEDEQAVLNLQRAYGYYIDRGLWQQAADLFAPDGSREEGQAGVYVGREHIRRALSLTRPRGLRAGELNDHLQIEPVVDVAPDGQSAQGRVFELAFVGGGGEPARLVQSVEENTYIRRGGVWMIKSLHSYTILATDYGQGWGKSALPAPVASQVFPPDRPPTVIYEAYPKVYTPPLHFNNASTGRPTQYAAGTAATPRDQGAATAPASAGGAVTDKQLAAAERQLQQVMDYNEIDNLQSAYGYYAEKFLWSDIAELFTDDGVLEIDDAQHAGRNRILAFLQSSGPEGPVKGALDSQLQLQPVIHVAADGRSARIRSRLLELTRDAQGRPMWGSGIYENEVVKEDGVWKFKRLHFYRSWKVDYRSGWSTPGGDKEQVFPSAFTPPFHYRNPVSGR